MKRLFFTASFALLITFASFAQNGLTNGKYLLVGFGPNAKTSNAPSYSEITFPQFKWGKIYYFGKVGQKSNWAFHWNFIDGSLHFYKLFETPPAFEFGTRAGVTYSIPVGDGTIDFSALYGPTIFMASSHDLGNDYVRYMYVGHTIVPSVQWRVNNNFIFGVSYSISESVSGSGDYYLGRFATRSMGNLTSASMSLMVGFYLGE